MITQTDVNTAFEMGEQRLYDIDQLLDDGPLEHAEIAGMMMGAFKAHARRTGKHIAEAAVELAEMICQACEDDDE